MPEYNLRRKAERWRAAEELAEMARSLGAEVEISPYPLQPLYPCVRVRYGPAYVGIKIEDGGMLAPWNVDYDSGVRFTPAFGAACAAEVNPFHRRKCMGFYPDFDSLKTYIERALICLSTGEALAKDQTP